MKDGPRRVLMLAYLFPPIAGAGVQRTLKFVRYLEPLGWQATVVSTRSRAYGTRDPSLVAEIPASTRVIRTFAVPLARYLSIVLYKLRLRRLRAWVLWPDNGLGWAPFALVAALRVARRDRPDVLFSTSAPYGSHLVALLVSRLTGIPWVADFRDEWTTNPHLAGQPRPLMALAARAERAITSRAQRIVVAAGYFELLGLDRDDPRRVEIPNGVDEADLSQVSTAETDRFVLAHVGTLYDIRDPSPVMRALATLVERGEIDADRLEVRLVGSVWLPGLDSAPGIRVTRTGYVEHRRAVEEMQRATVLLFYVPSSSLAPSGKLFEYLASGRPLLCLAHPDNLGSRLVREWDAGVVADPHDEAAIADALLALWRRCEQGDLPDQEAVRTKVLERFSRRAGAEQLAQVLQKARNA